MIYEVLWFPEGIRPQHSLFSLEDILEKDTDNRAGKDKNQSILQYEMIFPSMYNPPGDNNPTRTAADTKHHSDI